MSGGDVDFVGFGGLTEKLGEMLGALQKGQGMRKEELTFGRERLLAADAAALLIEDHSQTLLQRQEPISHALLGDVEDARRFPQTSLA